MVGVLIFHQARREHDARPHAPENTGHANGVRNADIKMGIAAEIDKLQRRTEERRGLFRLGDPLRGCAMGGRFAARAHNKVRLTAGADLTRDNAAAPELDIIGMCPKSQQRREFTRGFRYTLHEDGQL